MTRPTGSKNEAHDLALYVASSTRRADDTARQAKQPTSIMSNTVKLAAICLAGAFSSISFEARGEDLSCSNLEAKSTVIDVERNLLKNPMFLELFDIEGSEFSLENARADGSNGFKLECSATLFADLKPNARQKTTEKLVKNVFAATFKDGVPVRYTVRKTDDGKLYVEVSRK